MNTLSQLRALLLLPGKCIRGLALLIGLAAATELVADDPPPYLQRLGVADFDQEWVFMQGLNFGRFHCVPTSYANIFKYLANNGLPNMSTIEHHSSPDYVDSIVNEVTTLGALMFTNPESGTTGDASYDYAQLHMASREPGVLFYHWQYGPDWNWGTGRIQQVLASGSIARIGYGRYYRASHLGIPGDSWVRNGGHSVVCIGYDYRDSSDKWLLVNDPASSLVWDGSNYVSDEDETTQSQTVFQGKRTGNITLVTLQYGEVSHARYTHNTGANDEKRVVIDNMHQIHPVYAGWFETVVVEQQNVAAASAGSTETSATGRDASAADGTGKYHGAGEVRVVTPWQPQDQQGVIPNEFRFRPREEMVDWVPAIGEMSAYYLTKLGRVFRVDLTTGEHKLLHVLKGAKGLVEGGSTLDLYVLVQGQKGDQVVKLERGDNSLQTYDLPNRAVAIDHDPITGGPAVLDANLSQVHSLTENFDRRETTSIPRVADGAGGVIFKIDHRTGDVITARKGAFSFNRYSRRTGEQVPPRQAPPVRFGITALAPTENGLIAVQDGTTVQTYDRFGRQQNTQLSGLQAHGDIKMTRSHFAAKRGQMADQAWRNIWPVED